MWHVKHQEWASQICDPSQIFLGLAVSAYFEVHRGCKSTKYAEP